MLDGKLVYAIFAIVDWEGDVIVEAGTKFVWNDFTADQNVNGRSVFIFEDQVELVED